MDVHAALDRAIRLLSADPRDVAEELSDAARVALARRAWPFVFAEVRDLTQALIAVNGEHDRAYAENADVRRRLRAAETALHEDVAGLQRALGESHVATRAAENQIEKMGRAIGEALAELHTVDSAHLATMGPAISRAAAALRSVAWAEPDAAEVEESEPAYLGTGAGSSAHRKPEGLPDATAERCGKTMPPSLECPEPEAERSWTACGSVAPDGIDAAGLPCEKLIGHADLFHFARDERGTEHTWPIVLEGAS